MRWSVWWEVLGQCAGKRRAENRDTCCDIETFISEETFAFLHFLHFLHLDGCHKASLFLLKFHALFNGILDSFSTSGRGVPKVMQRSCKGHAKVMQRSCKGNARRITEAFRFNKNVHFRVYPGTPVGDSNTDLSGPSHVT